MKIIHRIILWQIIWLFVNFWRVPMPLLRPRYIIDKLRLLLSDPALESQFFDIIGLPRPHHGVVVLNVAPAYGLLLLVGISGEFFQSFLVLFPFLFLFLP